MSKSYLPSSSKRFFSVFSCESFSVSVLWIFVGFYCLCVQTVESQEPMKYRSRNFHLLCWCKLLAYTQGKVLKLAMFHYYVLLEACFLPPLWKPGYCIIPVRRVYPPCEISFLPTRRVPQAFERLAEKIATQCFALSFILITASMPFFMHLLDLSKRLCGSSCSLGLSPGSCHICTVRLS